MTSEAAGLKLSAGVALLLGIAGIGFALTSASQAIMLDGLFNVAYLFAALLTLKVAELVRRPDDEDFPFGYAYFEPLVNGTKGVMILGISILALINAVIALFTGGRTIAAGPAIVYALIATSLCMITAWWLARVHRHTASPLVGADVENWTVNAAVSGVVLLAFCAVKGFDVLGWERALPYVDPLLVTVIILVFLGVPIRMAWSALMALLNRAPPESTRGPLARIIETELQDLEPSKVFVRIIHPGRALYAVVHVMLPPQARFELAQMDAARDRLDTAVRRSHPHAIMDVIFTAEERFAAPMPGSGLPAAPAPA